MRQAKNKKYELDHDWKVIYPDECDEDDRKDKPGKQNTDPTPQSSSL